MAEGMRTGARDGGALRRGSPLTEGGGLLPPNESGASLPCPGEPCSYSVYKLEIFK